MNKSLTHEEFINRIYSINPNKKFQVIGNYIALNNKILVKDVYGECLMYPISLIRGDNPSIRSAINKTEYFINQAREVHGNLYDYKLVEYKDCRTKIKIICKNLNHNIFEQRPTQHFNNRSGCQKCAFENNLKSTTWSKFDFIQRGNNRHGDKYDYSKFIYVNNDTKGIIICKQHNQLFEQTPSNHLRGNGGCSECKKYTLSISKGWSDSKWQKQAEKSSNFDSYKLYIIKCWNENEEFYKIGKTYRTVKQRFCNKERMPYNYEIIKIIESNKVKDICELERITLKQLKKFSYIPKIKFHGANECFNKIGFDTLEI